MQDRAGIDSTCVTGCHVSRVTLSGVPVRLCRGNAEPPVESGLVRSDASYVHITLNFHDRGSPILSLLMFSKQVWRRIPVAVSRYPRLSRALPATGLCRPMRELATASGPSPNDPFASGTNAYYIDEMYRLWRQDPKVVHPSWNIYFSGMDKGLSSPQAFQPPPTTHLPHPADGAPALHPIGGAELDLHLKVCRADIISFAEQLNRS